MNINPEKIDELVNIFIRMDEAQQNLLLNNAKFAQEKTRFKKDALKLLGVNDEKDIKDTGDMSAALFLDLEAGLQQCEAVKDIKTFAKLLHELKSKTSEADFATIQATIYMEMVRKEPKLLDSYNIEIKVTKNDRDLRSKLHERCPTANYKHAVELWHKTRELLN